jgi:hypothetical protein
VCGWRTSQGADTAASPLQQNSRTPGPPAPTFAQLPATVKPAAIASTVCSVTSDDPAGTKKDAPQRRTRATHGLGRRGLAQPRSASASVRAATLRRCHPADAGALHGQPGLCARLLVRPAYLCWLLDVRALVVLGVFGGPAVRGRVEGQGVVRGRPGLLWPSTRGGSRSGT